MKELSQPLLSFRRLCPSNLVNLLVSVWEQQERLVHWGYHSHSEPLRGPCQPQGDPLGPLIASLWVAAGCGSVRQAAQFTDEYFTYTSMTVMLSLHRLLIYMLNGKPGLNGLWSNSGESVQDQSCR